MDDRQRTGGAPYQRLTDQVRGDKRGLDYLAGALQPIVLDLSSAQTLKEFALAGDVLYVDKLSTGTVKFRPDMSWQRGFPLGANSGVRDFPFKSLLLEWDAQPGETFVLWFGYGINIIPPNQDITTIGSITDPVRIAPMSYASSFDSAAVLAAGVNTTILAPGSNLDGVDIEDCGIVAFGAATAYITLLAKSSAPASIADGEIIFAASQSPTGASLPGSGLWQRRTISSGKGIYLRPESAGGSSIVNVKYNV
jgi:hypothetical protein